MKGAHLAAAALLVAACSNGPTTVGLRLREPAAIVAYRGVAAGSDLVRPLLAVASRRSDDLRLIDPNSDQPIFGPGVIFPLSIPTAPRPQLLASAKLGDGGADLLVSVSAGPAGVDDAGLPRTVPSLQVIETWTKTGRVAFEVPLDKLPAGTDILPAGTEILSVVGIPGPAGASPPRARLLVAATGKQLVAVEFTRGAAGEVVLDPATPVVKPINFEAVDMALLLAPDDSPNERRVFLASREAVDGASIFGVGELNGASDLTPPFVIKPLDARAPTVAVAASRVDERKANTDDPCSPYLFTGAAVVRVYAALDESGCGPRQRINCGIATLDPDAPPDPVNGQLADDLGAPTRTVQAVTVPTDVDHPGGSVPAQTYRAPMPVVGVPLHIAIGFAPAGGTFRQTTGQLAPSGCEASAGASSATPLLPLQPSAGVIDTSAVAMVTSSDGHVYWYDLGRSAPVNDTNALVGGTRAAVTSASTSPLTAGTWALGLWSDASGTVSSASVSVDPSLLPSFIQTWPGFTEGATWRLIWQGPLPSLQSRAGVIATIGGQTFAAFQTKAATATGWSVVAKVADPALGVHPGDLLELPAVGCVATITDVISASDPPDPRLAGPVPFAGGAVQLTETNPAAPCLPSPAVGAADPTTPATLTVRASALVLVNDHSGYMGRPVIDQPFIHAWLEESTLEGATDPASVEKLALARKARRIFYPINSPCPIPGAAAGSLGAQPVGCYGYLGYPPNQPDLPNTSLNNPLSPGPALRLRPGLFFIAATGVTPGLAVLARDTTLTFATSAGLIVTSRRPAVGGALPANLAVVDRTDTSKGFSGHDNEGVRFYVPYADDQVIEFSADGTATGVTSLR